MTNKGELPKYQVENSHEAIIPSETFNLVQQEIACRASQIKRNPNKKRKTALSGKLVCSQCGMHYQRKVTPYRAYWICPTFSKKGKDQCASKQIPEDVLYMSINGILSIGSFDEAFFNQKIECIEVFPSNKLIFAMRDGREIEAIWCDKSRKESWTSEMREEARKRELERRATLCQK